MRTKHVLLVDDSDIDNYINNRIIAISGISEKVTVMTSAADALQYLESVRDDFEEFPDIIFLDINMPMMDGFDFLEVAKYFPKVMDNKCFVVMLTSSSHQSDIDKAMKYGMVKDYIIKPLKAEMFKFFLN